MTRPVLTLLLLLAAAPAEPAVDATPMPGRHWVFFRDKGLTDPSVEADAVAAFAAAQPGPVLVRRERSPLGRFDRDDLPVVERYLQRVAALGGRRRAVSRWLNAASFDLPAGSVEAVARLPFVTRILPVGVRTRAEQVVELPRSLGQARRTRVDSAEAHGFYGPSFDQARMMGIPDLFYQGWLGSGVRLAIFDTGIRLVNTAVKSVRIVRQHDFLSGDHFGVAAADRSWQPAMAESLRYLGVVSDPALDAFGDRLALVFIADSFSYRYGAPRRALFVSHSTDRGQAWTAPEPVVLSARSSLYSSETFENVRLASKDSALYVAYNDLTTNFVGQPTSSAHVGLFIDRAWQGKSAVGAGRYPDIGLSGDTLVLACVSADTIITLRRAGADGLPQWSDSSTVAAGTRVNVLRLAVAGQEVVILAGTPDGELFSLRSQDLGRTFAAPIRLAGSGIFGIELTQAGSTLLLLGRDYGQPPLVRLGCWRSTDLGRTWSQVAAVDSSTSVGGFAAVIGGELQTEAWYEIGGLLHRTRSPDLGATWDPPSLVDTAGSCYLPALTTIGPVPAVATWIKRGDENAAWETGDEARFAFEQPDHGTRMASIIAGYQPRGLVGIAPAADLIIAKTELHKVSGGRYYEYDLEEDTYVEALEWVERIGADIVSTSLGYRGWYRDDEFDGRTAPISVAAALAARRGMVIVTAMGNRDSTYFPWPEPYIVAPADADGIIAAGGVERNLLPWRGTGLGPTSDGRIKPDLVALADTVAVADPDTSEGLEGSVGTSCATALIAGACALVKEAHPGWDSDSILAALLATSTRATPNCTFGYGVPRIDSLFKVFPPDDTVEPLPVDEIWAFPNPFIPDEQGRVRFGLGLTARTTWANITILSTGGTLVDSFSILSDPITQPGRYSDVGLLDEIGCWWDGLNADGRPVAPGLYLAVLRTGNATAVGKFAVVR